MVVDSLFLENLWKTYLQKYPEEKQALVSRIQRQVLERIIFGLSQTPGGGL